MPRLSDRRVIVSVLAIAVVATAIGVTLYEWTSERDLRDVSEVEAELRAALPVGSSEAAINEYLESRGFTPGTLVVSQQASMLDGDLIRAQIPAGTRIIVTGMKEHGTLFLPAKTRQIFFVLSNTNTLERIVVHERNDF